MLVLISESGNNSWKSLIQNEYDYILTVMYKIRKKTHHFQLPSLATQVTDMFPFIPFSPWDKTKAQTTGALRNKFLFPFTLHQKSLSKTWGQEWIFLKTQRASICWCGSTHLHFPAPPSAAEGPRLPSANRASGCGRLIECRGCVNKATLVIVWLSSKWER